MLLLSAIHHCPLTPEYNHLYINDGHHGYFLLGIHEINGNNTTFHIKYIQ